MKLTLLTLLAAIAAACAPAAASPSPAPGAAIVKSIEILILESFPVQVHAVVRGDLPDASCTKITSVEQARESNTFRLTLITETDPLARCAQVLTPFEQVVPLDVLDLPAGTYTVIAGGVQQTFELSVDNSPIEPHQNQPTPPGTAQPTEVQFVTAQQDVPIYGGPDVQYGIIGNIAAGQTAKVTGVSSDGTWWRVMCPDDTVGNCWVSADPALTQPSQPPG